MPTDRSAETDFQQRLKSVRRLTTISTALGPERTREELVPYLNEMAAEHEDEGETRDFLARACFLSRRPASASPVSAVGISVLPWLAIQSMEKDQCVLTISSPLLRPSCYILL